MQRTVVDGLVVDHESAVGMLQSGMGRQDGIVRLNNGSGDLGSRVDGEFELGFLAVVDRETLHQQRGESGAGSTAKGMEDEESLKTSALVRELANTVQHEVDDLLADGVVATSVVVGSIFLASNELFRVEERAVGTGTDLIDDSRLQIDKDSAGHMLARAALGEESVERVVNTTNGLVRGHLNLTKSSLAG